MNDTRSIVDSLIEKHAARTDCHITRVLGSWVVVSDGEVVDIDRRLALRECPLHRMLSNESAEEYISGKIGEFGHFTKRRVLVQDNISVPYGTSEMLMYALNKKTLDCAVLVCDGAGTVVTDAPEVVQGIGARMNGLFYTTPIPSILKRLRDRKCGVFEDARIDQMRGLKEAIRSGKKNIGVTVNACYGEPLPVIRDTARRHGVGVTIIALCATGASPERAEEVMSHADIVWSCASRHIRSMGDRAVLQITLGIPIFVLTQRGLDFVAAYAEAGDAEKIQGLDLSRRYLLSARPGFERVRVGTNLLYLSECDLPVEGKHVPRPLR